MKIMKNIPQSPKNQAFLKSLKSRRTVSSRKKRFVTARFKICLTENQTHHSVVTAPGPSYPISGTSGQKTAWLLQHSAEALATQATDAMYIPNYILTIFSDGSFIVSDTHTPPGSYLEESPLAHCYLASECTNAG